MALSAADIRQIRLNLGWSAAELSRRLGHPLELILSWESGAKEPDRTSVSFLKYWQANAEQNAVRLAQAPKAEQWLKTLGAAQIPRHQIDVEF